MSTQGTRDRASTEQETESRAERWDARPVLAASLRGTIAIVPILSAIISTTILVRAIPEPTSGAGTIAVAITVLAASTLVLVVVERLSRRLLPLALLLRMSLLFPDKAPPRYRIARKAASVRQLRHRVERAREVGRVDEPVRVAEDILTLIAGLTRHDKKTRGHSERVRVYTDLLTERLGLNHGERERLRWASLIHDIGKLEVPSSILNKPGRPSESEWERLKSHPAEGARIAAALLPWLGEWGQAIEHHHERWDGGGYPNALAGSQISMAGRIVAVADAYETMTAVRSYKSAMSHVAAREEVARCAGSQFDPHVVRAFLDIPLTQLVRVAGPISWLIQLPLLRHLQPAASQLVPGLAVSGANVATAAVIGTVAAAVAANAGHGHDHARSTSPAAVEMEDAEGPDPTPATTPGDAQTGGPVRDGRAPAVPAVDTRVDAVDRPDQASAPARHDAAGGPAEGSTAPSTSPTEDLLGLLDPVVPPTATDDVIDAVEEAAETVVEVVEDLTGGALPGVPLPPTEDLVDEVGDVVVEDLVEPVQDVVESVASAVPTAPAEDPVDTIIDLLDPEPTPQPLLPAPTPPSIPDSIESIELPGL